jgi:hypothetical protein
MALACCIVGKFLGVACHCFPLLLDISTFAARCLHVPINGSALGSEGWNCGREWSGNFAEMTPVTCRKSATWGKRLYFPSEGRHAEDFFARKIRRQPGANPRSWVPEASMLTTRLSHTAYKINTLHLHYKHQLMLLRETIAIIVTIMLR